METPSVVLAMNRRYFIEDKYLVIDCLYDQKVSSPKRAILCVGKCSFYSCYFSNLENKTIT